MSKYALDRELKPLAFLKPPVCGPLLPFINYALALMPKGLKGRALKCRKLKAEGFGGEKLPVLLMEPEGLSEPAPCLLYFHGGGFVMRAAKNHFALLADYAEAAPCKAIFLDYRLAPKHRYPVPPEDCFSAYKWLLENAEALCVDSSRIALGGDSAGGCLALSAALMARDRGLRSPALLLLVYPAADAEMRTPSMREFEDTPMWNARLNREMWRWYLGNEADKKESYASPLCSEDFSGLPAAYIETAEFDCLRDEGAALAEALRDAGVRAELNETKGTVHGYDVMRKAAIVKENVGRRASALRRAFYGEGA
ncbi:MAG: alpha/beta hydrolase [Oscillospiraceae bacterium]|nr:alpha/beta hydrolase [Oscillospiraceae bacterium]